MNGNGLRQKNGTINEPAPPNAWRNLDRKPIQSNNISEEKTNAVKSNNFTENSTNSSPSAGFELVNLAHKVNVAERLKRQKEKEAKMPTEEDMLKKLLGVGQNKSVQSESKPLQFPNNSQQVDLNKLFGKANLNEFSNSVPCPSNLPCPSSLPKPPTAWHQRSKANNEQQPPFMPTQFPLQQQQQFPLHQQQPQMLQPQFPNSHPMNMLGPSLQYFPHAHSNMPMPLNQYPMMPFNTPLQQPHLPPQMYHQHPEMLFYGNQNFPMPMMPQGTHPMMPGPQPYMNASHQLRMSMPYFDGPPNRGNPPPAMQTSPEGPQKLKPKTGSASAFIPLQAARKSVKGKSNVTNAQASNDSNKNDTNLEKTNEKTSEIVQVKCLLTISFFVQIVQIN